MIRTDAPAPLADVHSDGYTEASTSVAETAPNIATAAAIGRLVTGIASVAVPRLAGRPMGLGGSGPCDYLLAVFGAHSVALGLGYLVMEKNERRIWERIGVAVDLSDAVAALRQGARGALPRRQALTLAAFSTIYASMGAAQVFRHRRRPKPGR